jgi:hypothetical protein
MVLYFRWLSPFFKRCGRGFQDFLKVSPSFLFMLCGCVSSSLASWMSRFMYPVFAEVLFPVV